MARRNANGEGTIYRRKDGRYEAAACFSTTSGTRERLRVYGATRADVHAKLTVAKAQAAQGIPLPDKSWKLGEYLDYWLEAIIRVCRRPTTYMRYELTVRLHIKPVLGKQRLNALSVPQLQRFLSEQLAAGKSIRTVQIIREVLRSALSRAMKEELLVRNVAALVDVVQRDQRDFKPWTVEECRAFLTAAKTDPFYLAYLLMLIYGLRRGEVLGLRWCDIDFDTVKLHIRHQLQRVPGGMQLAPLKTKASRRDLELVELVASELQSRTRSLDPNAYVFVNVRGEPLGHNRLLRHFANICQEHNLRRIRLHDLRHSQATLLKKLGLQARDAQLILGHATVQTTQQIYQHGDEELQRKTLQQLERLLVRTKQTALPSTLPLLPSKPASLQGLAWLRGRDSNSIESFAATPLTEVMLVLKDRTKLWLLGRVAVKHCRQTSADFGMRSPIELWAFVSRWLGGNHGW